MLCFLCYFHPHPFTYHPKEKNNAPPSVLWNLLLARAPTYSYFTLSAITTTLLFSITPPCHHESSSKQRPFWNMACSPVTSLVTRVTTAYLQALFLFLKKAEELSPSPPQCSYRMLFIVIPPGFEPGAYALEVRCSIQLSYETVSHLLLGSLLVNRIDPNVVGGVH